MRLFLQRRIGPAFVGLAIGLECIFILLLAEQRVAFGQRILGDAFVGPLPDRFPRAGDHVLRSKSGQKSSLVLFGPDAQVARDAVPVVIEEATGSLDVVPFALDVFRALPIGLPPLRLFGRERRVLDFRSGIEDRAAARKQQGQGDQNARLACNFMPGDSVFGTGGFTKLSSVTSVAVWGDVLRGASSNGSIRSATRRTYSPRAAPALHQPITAQARDTREYSGI